MTGLGVGAAHAMTVAPEVAQHLADARSAGKPLALMNVRLTLSAPGELVTVHSR